MNPRSHNHLDTLAILSMIVLCAIWGMNQVSIKVANAGISPVMQAGLRSIGAALLLMIWARWRGVTLLRRDGCFGYGLLLGLIFTAEFAMLNGGLIYTSASRVVLFLYLAPF